MSGAAFEIKIPGGLTRIDADRLSLSTMYPITFYKLFYYNDAKIQVPQ